jgi:uncharacterized protein YdaU (DUF1376 family)
MEDLAYRRLIDLYYRRESALPADIQVTAKLVRLRFCAADVESVLNEFFTLTEDGWKHERCDAEIEKMQDKQKKARNSAAASVNARRANAERSLMKDQTNAERSLPDQQTDVELPTPTPTPTPIPKEKREPALASQSPPAQPPKPEKPKREQVTLLAYLEACKASKSKPIPDGHSIRTWATDAGLAPEMLQIAWLQFRERYTEGEKGKGKRYKDWPAHFATAVKANWFKLWFLDDAGQPAWTTVGLTHKAVLDAKAKREKANV